MPKQLELPFPKDDSDDFDSVYLDARVVLNTLEELNFGANMVKLTLFDHPDKAHSRVFVSVGHPERDALERDRDILAALIDDTGQAIQRGEHPKDATIIFGPAVITLHGAFPEPEKLVGRPTIEDLYPTTKFGERGPRGRLNPLMETALGSFRPREGE